MSSGGFRKRDLLSEYLWTGVSYAQPETTIEIAARATFVITDIFICVV